jgi:hypothetical protein
MTLILHNRFADRDMMMRYTDLAPGHLRPRTSEPASSNIYPGEVHNTDSEALDDGASNDVSAKCSRDVSEGMGQLRDDDCEKEAEEEEEDMDEEEEHSETDASDVDDSGLSDGYVSN